MSTFFPSSNSVVPRWYLVDASGETLGRLAARVAQLLRGKAAPHYTPFHDTGEHVVVINAAKVHVTGQKLDKKEYHHFTGTPGGLKSATLRVRMAKHSDQVVRDAIEGMLPNTRRGKHLASYLKVYSGAEHPHSAQQPQPVTLTKKRAAAV
ncbi:MAG: 50S ribosomal protein L13 [Terriglobales bacterium]